MKALQFRFSIPRYAYSKLAGHLRRNAYWDRHSALAYADIPEPGLRGPRWVRVQTRLCGICGSDMSALRLHGAADSPVTPFVSFPMVLGHEIVGRVVETGDAVRGVAVGDRVVVDPLLPCGPREIDPPCPSCRHGEVSLCRNFAEGALPPGMLISSNRALNGGFAPFVVVHEDQCIPVPEDIGDAQAVLADPIAVSLRAVLRHPPHERGICLVYGCGILGLGAVACLRALHPHVQIVALARHSFQRRWAERLGANEVITAGRAADIIGAVAQLTGGHSYRPFRGTPILLGGVQNVYDCVGTADTIGTSLRLCEAGGTVVIVGVAPPQRFEWSPIWFREINLTGSMSIGTENFQGERLHTYAVYLRLVRDGRLRLDGLITHRFALEQYADAFATCAARGNSGAVKVAFEFPN